MIERVVRPRIVVMFDDDTLGARVFLHVDVCVQHTARVAQAVRTEI